MTWQPIVAGIMVALAALWLLLRIWRTVRRGLQGDPSGSACSSCPNSSQPKQSQQGLVVPLAGKKHAEKSAEQP